MPHSEETSRPHGILRQESSENQHECASPTSYCDFNDGYSPKATPKSVSIAPRTETISPLLLGNQKDCDELDLDASDASRPRKNSLLRKTHSKRLSGRAPYRQSPSFPGSSLQNSELLDENIDSSDSRSHRRHSGHHLDHLISQVSDWIREERSKHAERKAKREQPTADDALTNGDATEDERDSQSTRHPSDTSAESFDLDKLESIIKHNLSLGRHSRHSRHRSPNSRTKSSIARLSRKQSSASDTESLEKEIQVPSCDAYLDNSKTLSYTGGASEDSDSSSDELQRTASYRDRDAWPQFKFEIVRLIHTLRLKGWRRVPMEMSNHITVQRLSGALTNAVYVVSPPEELPPREGSNGSISTPRKPPPKLLLRIYGPQVEHLIDREAELAILRRLARKKIGPRLLGTFSNGRFEEYLHAKPLTPEELRNPDTSRQIAKRMRELHDGITLLNREREEGAFVWRNWDKWVSRVEQVVSWLDSQVMQVKPGAKPTGTEAWKRRGFICGVPWKQFRNMVEKYRQWLYQQYGGSKHVNEELVFAHNDTQYGNILRLMPTGESPLLLPANTHKQLVVIDFEYASANLLGLEFANHFTEWCYDYHDERKPYAFHPNRYPTPEEQDRFLRAYVRHRPHYNLPTPTETPTMSAEGGSYPGDTPSRKLTSSISSFMLDARAPPGGTTNQPTEETSITPKEDKEVKRLMRETRLWRLANTAQWVAWGIVQAKVPGMPDFSGSDDVATQGDEEDQAREDLGDRAEGYRELAAAEEQQQEDEGDASSDKEEIVEEEFDYLGYAQHRALFFWADALQFGLVKPEELPGDLLAKVKSVPY